MSANASQREVISYLVELWQPSQPPCSAGWISLTPDGAHAFLFKALDFCDLLWPFSAVIGAGSCMSARAFSSVALRSARVLNVVPPLCSTF
jgi:hypothetical protein